MYASRAKNGVTLFSTVAYHTALFLSLLLPFPDNTIKTHLLSLQLLSSLFSHCPLPINSHFEDTGSWNRGLHPRPSLFPAPQTFCEPQLPSSRAGPDAQQCHERGLLQLQGKFWYRRWSRIAEGCGHTNTPSCPEPISKSKRKEGNKSSRHNFRQMGINIC